MRFPIGQPVTIPITVQQRNPDGTYSLVDPTTITVTVKLATAAGLTTTGTYNSPAHDGLGAYHQDIPVADLQGTGHYQYAVTTTGPGAGTVPGSFDVYGPFEAVQPPSLPPLAEPEDVAARLGRDLTDAEATRLGPLLADASVQIRRYCRRDFLLHVNETQVLHGHDSEIWLPGYPVQSVSSVVAVGGAPALPDVPVPFFTFDGIRTIRIDRGMHGIFNLPEAWFDESYPGTYRVTYSFGYTQVPDDVVMVAANAALGVLTAPTAAAGIVGETIGPYSYRLEAAGGGVRVALTQADLDQLKDYRNTVNTVQARLR